MFLTERKHNSFFITSKHISSWWSTSSANSHMKSYKVKPAGLFCGSLEKLHFCKFIHLKTGFFFCFESSELKKIILIYNNYSFIKITKMTIFFTQRHVSVQINIVHKRLHLLVLFFWFWGTQTDSRSIRTSSCGRSLLVPARQVIRSGGVEGLQRSIILVWCSRLQ